jgi:hypothetical protein
MTTELLVESEQRPSATEANTRNEETLRRFSQAWSCGDVDAVMAEMTENPTYRASVGKGPGSVYHGRDEVRAAISRLLSSPSVASSPAPAGVASSPAGVPPSVAGKEAFFGNRALSFWALPGRAPDGTPAVIEGVDVLTFDERGRIAVKDSYRKTW